MKNCTLFTCTSQPKCKLEQDYILKYVLTRVSICARMRAEYMIDCKTLLAIIIANVIYCRRFRLNGGNANDFTLITFAITRRTCDGRGVLINRELDLRSTL